MFDLIKLEKIVRKQKDNFQKKDSGIQRDINFNKYLKTKEITVISGIRRSGKSTLLKQFSQKFKNFYYINFDDEKLIYFTVRDFENLMNVFEESYSSKTIFLDEIQNIDKWERFVRRIYDEGYKIFITGSNAKLLSSELSTHLTGRYFKIELYPFSFKEFLKFKNINYQKKESKLKVIKQFNYYLKNGGFPEFLKYNDEEFLKRIYKDVLYKDLLIRFKIRETKSFKELAEYLFTNFTKELSYNTLKNILGFKSVNSVKNYIDFMQESFLIFEMYKYDHSLKKQYVSDKKIYNIDNGLRNSMAFLNTDDNGRLLENLVFIELKRKGKEIYYFKDKRECDFIIKEKNKILSAIQVCLELNEKNKEREINGLTSAMEKFNLKQGLILTGHQRDKIKIDSYNIKVMPTLEWLLF